LRAAATIEFIEPGIRWRQIEFRQARATQISATNVMTIVGGDCGRRRAMGHTFIDLKRW
jgi:hypothetical protein